jgi:benzoyl-CoA reductase/2-hydroxyglutaryl-CoA dehydratase subunit BcrC/BadD/HgdB
MISLSARIDQFMGHIRSAGVKGVIMSTTKYCDTAMYEQVPLAESVGKAGIPLLCLENSYDGVLSEQVETRIEAFFESMGREV